jgi:hypothetical protein
MSKERVGKTTRGKVKLSEINVDINRKVFYEDNLFFFNY